MASRCSTALVLPPSAMTVTMAFSKAFRVMMSLGLMSCLRSSSNALQHKSDYDLMSKAYIDILVFVWTRRVISMGSATRCNDGYTAMLRQFSNFDVSEPDVML